MSARRPITESGRIGAPRSGTARGRVARVLVAAGLLAAVALTLAFRYGTERMWWIEIARYVPYPAYLVPAVLLVALAWGLGWAWRGAAFLALGLVVTEVMGLAIGRADEGSDRMRLMTWNVKAYLAARRTPQPREHLLARLWSESSTSAAQKNLGNTLWAIRTLFS